MKAGVSTACLYPRLLEDSLYDLAVNGVSNVEIFINTHSELSRNFSASLSDTLKRFDVNCLSVHPYTSELEPIMFFSEYSRRINDALDYYKRYFEFMGIVGAKIFVFHGHKGNPKAPIEPYCEKYLMLRHLAKEFGITVAIENVTRCTSGNLNFLKNISKQLGNDVDFVIDTKQAIRSKENPFDMLKALKGKVCHAHISDNGELGDCLLLGRGRMNIKKFISDLYSFNPNANIVLELYRHNFNGISDLVNNFNILDNIIKNIEK